MLQYSQDLLIAKKDIWNNMGLSFKLKRDEKVYIVPKEETIEYEKLFGCNFDVPTFLALKLQDAYIAINELENAISSDPQPTKINTFGKKVSAWVGNMMNIF